MSLLILYTRVGGFFSLANYDDARDEAESFFRDEGCRGLKGIGGGWAVGRRWRRRGRSAVAVLGFGV
jgi:hypothetical protein